MLKIIDFSNGIRSEEIQENFNILQDEINRERINIGGTGIASGLEITPIITSDRFAIKVSASSIVTNDGEEIYIDEQILDIERPQLISQCDMLTANTSNQVTLKEIPYSLDRLKPAEYLESYASGYSGITVNYQNSVKTDDNIRVKAIDGNTLTLTGLIKRKVKVNYYYSAKRLDTIYIDNNNNIQVKVSSITSTTPSSIIPESYKYLIAFILVDAHYQEGQNDIPHANIVIKKDLRELRNIYTNEAGDLYLCGTPFKDLQFISMTEPKDPKENQLWLNPETNTLYIWKKVYNTNYKKSYTIVDGYNGDYTYRDFETDINYNINLDSLKVYVNGEELDEGEYIKLYNDIPIDIQNIDDTKTSNKFRVYKVLNSNDILTYNIKIMQSAMMWVPINKESYVNTKEVKIYGVDDSWQGGNYWSSTSAECLGEDEDGYKNKYKYFLFDWNKDKRCLFTPNKNELSIMINQVPLHTDQFEEITLYNAFDVLPDVVIQALQNNYGYDDWTMSSLNEDYDNFGIGFMLKEPLDALYLEGTYDDLNNRIDEEELYVECHINRAVAEAPTKRKLQRLATYVYEDSIVVEDTLNTVITISNDNYYRYNENQLEVYLNGIKLVKDIDYEEGADLTLADNSYDLRLTHNISKKFKLLKELHVDDVIQYRIISSFMSYDHINSLLDQLDLDYSSCLTKVGTLYTETQKLYENTYDILNNMSKEIEALKNNSAIDTDRFLTTNSVLKEENLPGSVINNLIQSVNHISEAFTYDGSTDINITSKDIREKDYMILIHRDYRNNKDNFLIRDIDYNIKDIFLNSSYSQTRLVFNNNITSSLNSGDLIIISGIKIGKEGR